MGCPHYNIGGLEAERDTERDTVRKFLEKKFRKRCWSHELRQWSGTQEKNMGSRDACKVYWTELDHWFALNKKRVRNREELRALSDSISRDKGQETIGRVG